MHELGIAQNIVDAVMREMTERRLLSVTTIALRIGAMTDVDSDALSFGFQILTKETPLEQSQLRIERVPVRGRCGACRHDFEIAGYAFQCPACCSREVKLVSGTELDIAYLEIPD